MHSVSEFSFYLRTGRRLQRDKPVQLKYNHWHDAENGQFTFHGRGNYFGPGSSRPSENVSHSNAPKLALNGRNPRVRMGGNGGPPLNDPKTLEHAFPGVSSSPGGAIIGLADNFLDLTGPAQALTTKQSKGYAIRLIKEIRSLDPGYRLDTLELGGFPTTAEGQTNLINRLRLDRAIAYYNKGDLRPYQIETVRFTQRAANEEYEVGLSELRAGRLPVHISVELTLGNFVDGAVRRRKRDFHRNNGIPIGRNDPVQVDRNAKNTPEGSYTRPDSRVGNIAIDVSLERKTLRKAQIRGFFNSDFQPAAVIIVRPRQLGPKSTYIIKSPSGK